MSTIDAKPNTLTPEAQAERDRIIGIIKMMIMRHEADAARYAQMVNMDSFVKMHEEYGAAVLTGLIKVIEKNLSIPEMLVAMRQKSREYDEYKRQNGQSDA